MSMDKVFVALDQMSEEEIRTLLLAAQNKIKKIKIGLELFLKYGPSLINRLKNEFNVDIFLDLKLHDIPVTVEKAIASLSGLPIEFLTIHLSGGENMIKSALISAKVNLPTTKILGVSFLTSLETNDTETMFNCALNDAAFIRMFQLAKKTEIHGVVCSPKEIGLLKSVSQDILVITPGVRFKSEILEGKNIEDQKRVLSIEEAFINGADYIVMGRSLTRLSGPNQLLEKIHSINQL